MSYSWDPKDDVEVQWQKWSEANPVTEMPDVDFDMVKEQTIKDLQFVSQMDVKEYTLYQKWCEVQERYPFVTVNDLWEGETKVLEDGLVHGIGCAKETAGDVPECTGHILNTAGTRK